MNPPPPFWVMATAIQTQLDCLKGSLRWGSRCTVKQEKPSGQYCLSGCGANQGQGYNFVFIILAEESHAFWK